ncbi:hypothetical protein KKG05_04785, partial [bacterium]|nr:hypothetical protein [bacterium]
MDRNDCELEEDGLVTNPDGSFTFRQTTDENDVAPLYEGPFTLPSGSCTDLGGFEIYCGWDADFGWKHYWPDFNTPDVTIQSVQVLICAWDVDAEPCTTIIPNNHYCEVDNIFMDGELQNPEALSGDTRIWALSTFDVDPAKILDDGYLDMFIDIDVFNNPPPGCVWGVTVGWSQLVVNYSIGGTPDYPIRVDCQGFTGLGNTSGAGNDCDTRASEDEIWEIEILEDGEYTFSLCNTNPMWDSYIYLDEEICGLSHLAYDDD